MIGNNENLAERLNRLDNHRIKENEYLDLPELTATNFQRGPFYTNSIPLSREEGLAAFARGRPKALTTKKLTSIRLSEETLEFFKAKGKGWQTRMDAALKEWITMQEAQKS